MEIPEFVLKRGIYWLRGPNGSGKTTLAKILSGIIPSEGAITINDHISLAEKPYQYRLLVNYGESEPQYPGFLTAADLVHFYAHAKKASEVQTRELTEVFGIDRYLHQPCGTYSSGMLKRLSLVLSLIGNPALVILDEPQNALDDEGHAMLDQCINTRFSESDVTFILASHETITANYDALLTIRNKTLEVDDAS